MITIMSRSFFDHLLALPHHIRQYNSGALIFERDEPVVSYFAVRAGKAQLLRRQTDGTKVILQRAKAGSILAEASLNTDFYHCSANAISDLELVVIKRQKVQDMLASRPNAAQALMIHLAQEVQNARRRAEILSLKRVAERLDAWLVWHDQILPEKGEWHRLAAEIGVSPEALYRALAKRR